MDNALIHHFVDKRNRRVQELTALRFVAAGDCRPKFLDLRAQLAAIAAVDLISLYVLPNAF